MLQLNYAWDLYMKAFCVHWFGHFLSWTTSLWYQPLQGSWLGATLVWSLSFSCGICAMMLASRIAGPPVAGSVSSLVSFLFLACSMPQSLVE